MDKLVYLLCHLMFLFYIIFSFHLMLSSTSQFNSSSNVADVERELKEEAEVLKSLQEKYIEQLRLVIGERVALNRIIQAAEVERAKQHCGTYSEESLAASSQTLKSLRSHLRSVAAAVTANAAMTAAASVSLAMANNAISMGIPIPPSVSNPLSLSSMPPTLSGNPLSSSGVVNMNTTANAPQVALSSPSLLGSMNVMGLMQGKPAETMGKKLGSMSGLDITQGIPPSQTAMGRMPSSSTSASAVSPVLAGNMISNVMMGSSAEKNVPSSLAGTRGLSNPMMQMGIASKTTSGVNSGRNSMGGGSMSASSLLHEVSSAPRSATTASLLQNITQGHASGKQQKTTLPQPPYGYAYVSNDQSIGDGADGADGPGPGASNPTSYYAPMEMGINMSSAMHSLGGSADERLDMYSWASGAHDVSDTSGMLHSSDPTAGLGLGLDLKHTGVHPNMLGDPMEAGIVVTEDDNGDEDDDQDEDDGEDEDEEDDDGDDAGEESEEERSQKIRALLSRYGANSSDEEYED
eukprot:TRINITY_DN6497_c0_g1_i2.p1 TRINITY_DN6497_c0_g1~~TRINITY_DN6497_c0_g1_i2.p1  ORF type:complete len:520 (+),score=108.63 TRINITY_DN6497_c0_g1_i2:306-1865(+)